MFCVFTNGIKNRVPSQVKRENITFYSEIAQQLKFCGALAQFRGEGDNIMTSKQWQNGRKGSESRDRCLTEHEYNISKMSCPIPFHID